MGKGGNRSNVHVVKTNDGWGAKREGNTRSTAVANTQAGAIKIARDMARQGQGELLIHGENGQIRARDSYGNDPPESKG